MVATNSNSRNFLTISRFPYYFQKRFMPSQNNEYLYKFVCTKIIVA